MAPTLKHLPIVLVVSITLTFWLHPVSLVSEAETYLTQAIQIMEEAEKEWLKQDTLRTQNTQNSAIVEDTIENLIKKKNNFCKKNTYNSALIRNKSLRSTLLSLSDLSDLDEKELKRFDRHAYNGAKLAYKLMVEDTYPTYEEDSAAVRDLRNLLTFFYIHAIRLRNGALHGATGPRHIVFVIEDSYPALRTFIKEHASLCPRLWGGPYSLNVTEDEEQLKIELYPRSDDEQELHTLMFDPVNCDHPSQIPQKIVAEAGTTLDLTSLQRPLTISALLHTAVNAHKHGDFQGKTAQKRLKHFLFTLYAENLSFYSSQISRRTGTECRIGPEVLVSSFFRQLSAKKTTNKWRIHVALQGLFIELEELRRKYYLTFVHAVSTEKCHKAFQTFADHAAIMSRFIEEPFVKKYLQQLALICRYYITKNDPFPINLVFESSSHQRIRRSAAAWITADIIKKLCYQTPLKKCFDIKKSRVKKISLAALQKKAVPFEHALFSNKTGLLAQAEKLARHIKKPIVIAPLIEVMHQVHLACKGQSENLEKARLKIFCSKLMTIWQKILPWVTTIHEKLELPPPDFSQKEAPSKKKKMSALLKNAYASLLTNSSSSNSSTGALAASIANDLMKTSTYSGSAEEIISRRIAPMNEKNENNIFKSKSLKNLTPLDDNDDE